VLFCKKNPEKDRSVALNLLLKEIGRIKDVDRHRIIEFKETKQ